MAMPSFVRARLAAALIGLLGCANSVDEPAPRNATGATGAPMLTTGGGGESTASAGLGPNAVGGMGGSSAPPTTNAGGGLGGGGESAGEAALGGQDGGS